MSKRYMLYARGKRQKESDQQTKYVPGEKMSRRYVLYTRGQISVDTTPAPVVPAGTVFLRAAKVALVDGLNIVTFSSPLSSNQWILLTADMILSSNASYYELYDLVVNPTTTGFQITPPEAGVMTYAVVLPS